MVKPMGFYRAVLHVAALMASRNRGCRYEVWTAVQGSNQVAGTRA